MLVGRLGWYAGSLVEGEVAFGLGFSFFFFLSALESSLAFSSVMKGMCVFF